MDQIIQDGQFHMWVTYAVVSIAIVSYALEKVSLELTSLCVIAFFLLFFNIFPLTDAAGESMLTTKSLLQGFADPALVTVLSLLVLGQALVQTGALDDLARFMIKTGLKKPKFVVKAILVFVMIISGIMNNTPVVVIFIPILSAMALRLKGSPSTVMIPLSFAAILGGNLTLIGSSTNLLAAGSLQATTGQTLGFFDITIVGSVVAVFGFFYLIFIAPRLLTHNAPSNQNGDDYVSGKHFLVDFLVTKESGLIGMESVAGMFPEMKNMTVRMVERHGQSHLPPFDLTLKEGDHVVVATTRTDLMNQIKQKPDMIMGTLSLNMDYDVSKPKKFVSKSLILAESVIAPASRVEGRTLRQIAFHRQTGCVVIGIQRRSRMIRQSLEDIKLEAGDVLLILGERHKVLNLRSDHDVLLMTWSMSDMHMSDKSKISLSIFGVIVTLVSTGLLPTSVAALTGVCFMIGLGALNIRQAARAVDRRIILIIAAALAMGNSMSATGGAAFLAESLLSALDGTSPTLILSAFFLLIAILTNILSNNATAVLFTPIAVSIASTLGVDQAAFVVAVIIAANCSFATPMGYQTNLLVMAPGHYRFSDFMKVGIPLIFLIWLVFSFFAPWYYNFG